MPSIIQSCHSEKGSGVAPVCVFGSNVQAGNTVYVAQMAFKATAADWVVGNVTKTAGTATLGTGTLERQVKKSGVGAHSETVGIWKFPVTGTGSLTLTGQSASGDYSNMVAFETDADTVEATATNTAGGPGTNVNMTIGNMTSAGAAIFFGAFGVYTSGSATYTPDAAFTTVYNEGSASYNATATIYRIVTGATTDSVDCRVNDVDTPGWAGVSVLLKASAAGVAAGLSSETDSAFAVTKAKRKAAGLVTETASSLPAGKSKQRAIGATSETGSALAPTAKKQRAVGLASETGSALATSKLKARAVGQPTETDSAFDVSRAASFILGIALSTEVSLAVTRVKARAVALASDLSTSLAAGRSKRKAVGRTTETDSAFSATGGTPPPTVSDFLLKYPLTSSIMRLLKQRAKRRTRKGGWTSN